MRSAHRPSPHNASPHRSPASHRHADGAVLALAAAAGLLAMSGCARSLPTVRADAAPHVRDAQHALASVHRRLPSVRAWVGVTEARSSERFLAEAEAHFDQARDLAFDGNWTGAELEAQLAEAQLEAAIDTATRDTWERRQLDDALVDLDAVLARARRAVSRTVFDPVSNVHLAKATALRRRAETLKREGRFTKACWQAADARDLATIAIEYAQIAPQVDDGAMEMVAFALPLR